MNALAAASQASYPRVSFLASVAASNVNRQLDAIQADMRSNLTAHFAPTIVTITFSILPSSGRRRMLEGPQSTSSIGSFGDSDKCNKDEVGPLITETEFCQDQGNKSKLMKGSEGSTQRRQASPSLEVKQAMLFDGEKPGKGGSAVIRSKISHEVEPAAVEVVQTRQLLQSGTVNLQVNVTFPSTTQNTASQGLATAFNQALQNNPSSALGGFEQGYGAVGVTSVALSYVTASDSGLNSPPASPPAGTGDGSVGTFIGIAVAAVLGLTVLAGKAPMLVSHFECMLPPACLPIKTISSGLMCSEKGSIASGICFEKHISHMRKASVLTIRQFASIWSR